MPELLTHVINTHGIQPYYPNGDPTTWAGGVHFRALDDLSVRILPIEGTSARKYTDQDAEFVSWLGSHANPVWADVALVKAKTDELPVEHITLTRAITPWYAHQGRYTTYEHQERTFLHLTGEASFPKFDSTYTTPIYIARLMLHSVGTRLFKSNVNRAQLIQSVAVSKAKHTRIANQAAEKQKQSSNTSHYDRMTVWTY